jgi:AraC family transcriptional regulator, regulatory protein of adaptative response / methylated-DNA-[protein]-cysteine methyltransferase
MLNEEKCWEAVRGHDASQDGQWVYSTKTTGVYCRPGCASRQPLRKNVAFYATNEEAEAAGFRPCKRCRPNEGSQADRHIAAVERACALIRGRDTLPSLDELASAAGISRYHFHRVFKQITGATPREWGKAYRLGRFAARLDAGENVAEAVYAAGFGASSRAYEAAPTGLGMTPSARRHGGRGETIRFTCVKTALGWALVAATARGICMTALGDDKAPLEADLRRRFPAALIWPADEQLKRWSERIVSFVTDPAEQPDLPLDIRGTAFQARVWRALQKVPPGKTSTYTEIAEALGQPKAVRAVAAACAANKLALLVPCHRIVRRDGDLAGYRWGVERKQKLLAAEQASAQAEEAAE